jgi:peptide/nickel transport system substrate-binding protein
MTHGINVRAPSWRRTSRGRASLVFAALPILAAFIAVAAVTPGLKGPDAKEAVSARNRIVIGVRGDVSSFNIYTATNAFTQDVIDLLQPRLAEEQDDFREGPPTFRAALATSWEFSADHKTLTFHLDPKWRWSDGAPVTSADVVFSNQAAASPAVAWVGSDVKQAIAAVTAPDPRTVVFRFAQVYPYQLMDAVEGNILPERVYRETPLEAWPKHAFLTAPVSGGPFLLKRYERGTLIELVRNPDYARAPLPRLDVVVFRVLPDETTLVNELLAGGIDFMENLPAAAVKTVGASTRLRIVRAPDLSYTFISWNTARPLFSDARVRRALTLAIDRGAIIEGLLPETGRPSAGPVLSCMWACDPSLKPLPYDPDAARRLLAESGWKDSDGDGLLDRDGRVFRFDLETNQGSGLRADIAQMVAAQLHKVGIEAVPRTFEFGAFIARHEKHEYDAFVGSWRESTKVDLTSAFHSASRTGGYNYGSYADAELDGILGRARLEVDREAARRLWWRAQQIIVRDQPCTFLFERDQLHAVPRNLHGFRPSPRTAYAGLEEWSLGDDGQGR